MSGFKGTITTSGSSEAIRLDKALFRQHTEFRQKARVAAHVIGPGTLLVKVVGESAATTEEDDPMLAAFLAFLEKDATSHPERIVPLSRSRIAEGIELTKGMSVSDDEEIPDDFSLP